MEKSLDLAVAFLLGMGLGAFYFLFLWKTLQKIPDVDNPGFVMFRSFIIRTAVVLSGFYLIMDHSWERIVAALFGFIVMREVLTRIKGKAPEVS
ncbi:MAG TPA: ATP synthase subunit I [Deltaproteobacteria bacterium]|nr:ATP synthase subunit I [Deltaproteobacteria bacterium]